MKCHVREHPPKKGYVCLHFHDIFINGCTGSCQNDNFQCSQWWNCQKEEFSALQWRHNGHDGLSNHQPHPCLLNRLYRRISKKTSKLCVTGLCVRNSPVTGEFPHKWPVTRKIFPLDYIIIVAVNGQEAQLDIRAGKCDNMIWTRFKGLRPVLEGFVVTMHEGMCETGSQIPRALARGIWRTVRTSPSALWQQTPTDRS